MKRLLISLILCVVTLTSCKEKEEDTSQPTPREFAFLIGDWERTNEEPGKETYEQWRNVSAMELRGLGYTLQDGDTIFKENLRLFQKDSIWKLRVTGVNDAPVDFKVTAKNNHSFTAENPENEFPSKIMYGYFDNTLTAKVSGDAMEVSFIFWRVE